MKEKDSLIMAYTAGILDGDGSFSIIKKRGRKETHAPLYYPLIQLANASEELINFLKSTFGGHKGLRKAHVAKDGGKRKNSYHWKIEKSASCLPFLESIIPWLVLKKERAEFLKDFILKNPASKGSSGTPKETLEYREQAYLKMKNFNDFRDTETILSEKTDKISTSEKDWAYIAGLIDTDGSFSVKKELGDKKMIHPKYTPQFLISLTDAKGVNFIRNAISFGHAFAIKSKSCTSGMCYRFSISSRLELIEFLKNVLPYLRIKLHQAKILIDFCSNFSQTFYPRQGILKEELDFRESCYQSIKSLNSMGSINLL